MIIVNGALCHALEYTGKFAACTPERAAALEIAFNGCRRAEALGSFYNNPFVRRNNEKKADIPCPCGKRDCVLVERKDVGWQPVTYFDHKGIRDVESFPAAPFENGRTAEALLRPVSGGAP
jgi:hypothetical protein